MASNTNIDAAFVAHRVAIEDLYDRQLDAVERNDMAAYRETFAEDAKVDLTGIGAEVFTLDAYLAWLIELQRSILSAQRLRGGLRLDLGDGVAEARVPVACHVTFDSPEGPNLAHAGVRYDDQLRLASGQWRVVRRVESIAWTW